MDLKVIKSYFKLKMIKYKKLENLLLKKSLLSEKVLKISSIKGIYKSLFYNNTVKEFMSRIIMS